MQRRWCGAGALVLALSALAPAAIAQQIKMYEEPGGDPGGDGYHVVEQGDTLYDLSGRYLEDEMAWPKLWSFNPQITNPHWIYPGDLVALRPNVPGAPAPRGERGRPISSSYVAPGSNDLHVAVGGFIVDERLPYVGRIVASPKEAQLLAEHDPVWVGFGQRAYTREERARMSEEELGRVREAADRRPGATYAIVRETDMVEDADGDEIGVKYEVIGALRLTELSEKYLDSAAITQSFLAAKRGDFLVPYERQLKRVGLVASDADRVARVVDTVRPQTLVGEWSYVLVDKGAEDGVRPGNRLHVFQRDEGLVRDRDEIDDEIPWRRVGQVMLVDVRQRYSTALVIDSRAPIEIGDRLEMYRDN